MKRRAGVVAGTAVPLPLCGVALAATVACPNRPGGICVGTNQADTLNGRSVADDMRGRGDADRLRALRGADFLNAGPANDALQGAEGGDRYVFGDDWGDDTLADAAGGRDTLDFSGVAAGVTADLTPGEGAETYVNGLNTVDFSATTIIEDALGGSEQDYLSGCLRRHAVSSFCYRAALLHR